MSQPQPEFHPIPVDQRVKAKLPDNAKAYETKIDSHKYGVLVFNAEVTPNDYRTFITVGPKKGNNPAPWKALIACIHKFSEDRHFAIGVPPARYWYNPPFGEATIYGIELKDESLIGFFEKGGKGDEPT